MKNTRLARARLSACRRWPAATSAILSLVPVEKPGLGTLAVDKHWRLYFDPLFLDSVDDETAGTIILHEVSHLLLKHHARGGSATDWELWNIATDCAVNYRLHVEGHHIPEDWMTPIRFQLPGNLSAEQYYRHLEDQKNAEQPQGDEPESATEPGSQEEPDEQGSEAQAGDGTDPGEDGQPSAEAEGEEAQDGTGGEGSESGAGDGEHTEAQGMEHGGNPAHEDSGDLQSDGTGERVSARPGESGSCSDGQMKPWEDPPPEADGKGPPVIEPHEQEQLIRKVAEAIEQKGGGKGAWSSFVENVLHPKVDPRVLLTQAIRKAAEQISGGHDDTSYRRPSRRPTQGGVIRPSRVALIPRILVIVDSSGSMGQKDLGYALGLIGKVLSGFRLRDGVQVMVGDTAVQSCDKVFDPKRLNIQGGGGTEMDRLIVEGAKLTPQPQLIVVATDGYTDWPRENVGVPVVACLTRENTKRDVPAWIKSIVMA